MFYHCNGKSCIPSGMGFLKCSLAKENLVLWSQSFNQKTLKTTLKRHEVCVSNGDCNMAISGEYHLFVGDVHAFIPKNNLSGHVQQSDFDLNIIQDESYFPKLDDSQSICSPVVHFKPHGAKFHSTDPALIHLPINVELKAIDEITCLCSDTSVNENPIWEPLLPESYSLNGSVVELKTTHFSFFTAITNKHYPEASKMIFAGVGDILDVPEVPGVQVNFPGSAVKYDIEATIKVMFADGPYDVNHDDPTSYALAAPVVKLGPTGHEFNPESIEPVEVQLPLPHGKEIMENCSRPYLTFWQSTTAEGQDLEWKLFKTHYRLIEHEDHRLFVCFPVTHFTFFRVLWSVLDSAIHEAKIGASFFYPNFEFCISFQAFMSENIDDQTFGLCCLCYKKGTSPETIGNYPVFVGSSGLRMVKSGLLQIRIVSNLFEANTDFGEESLVQREFFTGRAFDKQFACKFIGPRASDQSTIGKIYIDRVLDNSEIEPLFDFLLTKPPSSQERPHSISGSHHSRRVEINHQSNWEGQLSQELANILSIKTDQDLGDGVWEDIARALGYTELEIDMKFKGEDEPFTKLLDDYKKRGGSPNDFISAMYSVGRKANLSSFEERLQRVLPSSNDRQEEDDLAACAGSISPSHTSTSSGVVLPAAPFNARKRRHTEAPEGPISDAKLCIVAERDQIQKKWKILGRNLGLREDQITEIERDYKNDGIKEQAYQMLLAWRESFPDNGYETLINALSKLNLNAVARQLYFSS